MPLILKENSSLKKNRYDLPKDMEKHLNNTLHTYSQYTDAEGAKRLRTLTSDDYNHRSDIDDGKISFSAMKDWNHTLRHCDKSDDNLTYQLNGGDKALNYTQDLLRKETTKVKKQNAQNKVATRQLNSTKPTVKPTTVVKPTAADANDVKLESVKTIRLSSNQLSVLQEYRNEPTLPFDGSERKENYLQFIDWLEEIGQYGKLPSSSTKVKDVYNEYIINAIISDILDDNSMYDNLVSDTLDDMWYKYINEIDAISTFDPNTYRTELGYGNIERVQDSLTVFGSKIFDEQFASKIQKSIYSFLNGWKLDVNDRNLVYVERCINVPELLSKEIYTCYPEDNQLDFYSFLLKHFGTSIGTCWSYSKNMGYPYDGEAFYKNVSTSPIVLHGYVDLKDVDIQHTISLNIYDLKDEEEIRLNEDAKVEIFAITTDSGKKFPLRQPIIVHA